MLASNVFVAPKREELTGTHLGEPGQKTQGILDSAKGGVLFIDEAYSLVHQYSGGPDPFGAEVIEKLLTAMEDPGESPVIILAGYQDKMDDVFRSNRGLRSRITNIHFDDYSIRELVEIFEKMARDQNFHLANGVFEKVESVITELKRQCGKGFGNAREVRKIFERAVNHNLPVRLGAGLTGATNQELQTLIPEDISLPKEP